MPYMAITRTKQVKTHKVLGSGLTHARCLVKVSYLQVVDRESKPPRAAEGAGLVGLTHRDWHRVRSGLTPGYHMFPPASTPCAVTLTPPVWELSSPCHGGRATGLPFNPADAASRWLGGT